MKLFKLFGGAAVGATLLAGALGSAAILDVNHGSLQAADLNNLKCDANGVTIDGYGVELDTLIANSITISDIDAACVGQKWGIQIQHGGMKTNIEATVAAGTQKISFGKQIPIADITGVHIVIG